jgi:hypothetical protein
LFQAEAVLMGPMVGRGQAAAVLLGVVVLLAADLWAAADLGSRQVLAVNLRGAVDVLQEAVLRVLALVVLLLALVGWVAVAVLLYLQHLQVVRAATATPLSGFSGDT